MEHVKSAMKPCSVCWGGEHVLPTVSVLSEECLHTQTLLWLLVQARLPAWELAADQHDFSTTSGPKNSQKHLLLLINGSVSAAHSLSLFFFAQGPYRPEMWWFTARYF